MFSTNGIDRSKGIMDSQTQILIFRSKGSMRVDTGSEPGINEGQISNGSWQGRPCNGQACAVRPEPRIVESLLFKSLPVMHC